MYSSQPIRNREDHQAALKEIERLFEAIKQDLDKLDSEQLQKVSDFINSLRLSDRQHRQIRLDPVQLATVLTEFSAEDRAFAEAGMSDYAAMLAQED